MNFQAWQGKVMTGTHRQLQAWVLLLQRWCLCLGAWLHGVPVNAWRWLSTAVHFTCPCGPRANIPGGQSAHDLPCTGFSNPPVFIVGTRRVWVVDNACCISSAHRCKGPALNLPDQHVRLLRAEVLAVLISYCLSLFQGGPPGFRPDGEDQGGDDARQCGGGPAGVRSRLLPVCEGGGRFRGAAGEGSPAKGRWHATQTSGQGLVAGDVCCYLVDAQ